METGRGLFPYHDMRQASGEGCRPGMQAFALRRDEGVERLHRVETGEIIFPRTRPERSGPSAEALFEKDPGGSAAFVAERQRLRSVTATIPG